MKKPLLLLLLLSQLNNVFSQTASPTCITATPICTSTTNSFPSSAGASSGEVGPDYSCLLSQPNPAWFYFKVDNPGDFVIDITQLAVPSGMGVDADFICWGPFSSPTTPCSGQLTAAKVKSCSYSASYFETAIVDSALHDEYYILMITNFAGVPAEVTFSFSGSSTGTVYCSETCTSHADYVSPLCVNATLQLLATYHFGLGNYSWSGPNGFSSTIQNPTIAGVDGSDAGYYYLNYTRDSTCNYTDSVWVDVDTCGTLTGNVFADGNSNCTMDSLENAISNVQLKLSQTGTFVAFAWTDVFGYYYFDVPAGNYTLEVMPSAAHPITCSSSMAHMVTVSSSVISTENFAIDCNALDVAATGLMVTGVAFFPGQTDHMFPIAASLGPDCSSTPVPGEVMVILDPLTYYTGPYLSYPGPTSVSGDTLKWTVADVHSLNTYSFAHFAFQYMTITSATLTDTVHFKMIILPITGDIDSTNNVYERDFIVGNSYDPNSKEVLPSGSGPSGFIPANTPQLEYIINFQNKGTASAHNIYILDTLDADVDITSLQVIASSHLETTTFLPGNVLKFNFSNIMLADSTSNEAMSHGFVKYTIAPNAGLNPGDQITNRAFIYFDYNPPVITNTAINTIEFPLGITENHDYQLGVSPNPTNNSVTISFEDKKSQSLSLKIVNISGQIIFEENVANVNGKYNKVLDLSAYPKGVYLLEIATDKQIVHKKIVKN